MLKLWFVANTLLAPIHINLGGFRLGLNVVVLILAGFIWFRGRLAITSLTAKVILALICYLLFSFVVVINSPCDNDKLIKLLLSIPVLFFLIIFGFEVGSRASDSDWFALQKFAPWAVLFAFSSLIAESLMPDAFPNQEGFRSEGKLSGLFGEPSQVAYFLFPWIAILLISDIRHIRLKGMLAFFS